MQGGRSNGGRPQGPHPAIHGSGLLQVLFQFYVVRLLDDGTHGMVTDLSHALAFQSHLLTDLCHGARLHADAVEALDDMAVTLLQVFENCRQLLFENVLLQLLLRVGSILVGNYLCQTQLVASSHRGIDGECAGASLFERGVVSVTGHAVDAPQLLDGFADSVAHEWSGVGGEVLTP